MLSAIYNHRDGSPVFGFLMLFCMVTAVWGQEKDDRSLEVVKNVSFSEVLTGLGDKDVSSYFDRNQILARAVDDRGLGFALSPNARRVIKEAGGSELLFIALERGETKRTEAIPRLIKELRIPGDKTISDIGRRIAISKERIAKITALIYTLGDRNLLVGDEFDLRQYVDWAEKALVSAERGLAQLLKYYPNK